MDGVVVAIYLAGAAEATMRPQEVAEVRAGRGIVGDRYFDSTGTWSKGAADHRAKRQITFIESEAVDAVRRDYGIEIDASNTRRNVLTTGVALNHLVDREFTVGDARFRGIGLCEPCQHVERVSGKRIRAAFVHRGGLNAEVLADGTIRPGDAIRTDATGTKGPT